MRIVTAHAIQIQMSGHVMHRATGTEEKIRLAGIRTLTSAIPVQRSNQLS